MARDMRALFAHQTPPRSTRQLVHQAETEDLSTDPARNSSSSSYRTVRTGGIRSVQGAPSPSGLQRLSAEAWKPDSLIRDWMMWTEPLLPYYENFSDKFVAWNAIS